MQALLNNCKISTDLTPVKKILHRNRKQNFVFTVTKLKKVRKIFKSAKKKV